MSGAPVGLLFGTLADVPAWLTILVPACSQSVDFESVEIPKRLFDTISWGVEKAW